MITFISCSKQSWSLMPSMDMPRDLTTATAVDRSSHKAALTNCHNGWCYQVGSIPEGVLMPMARLRTLDLSHNRLMGQVPTCLGQLTELRVSVRIGPSSFAPHTDGPVVHTNRVNWTVVDN
jgi:hypothetical protein